MPTPKLSWLTRALLPDSTQTSEKQGYYAEFHADGQLLHFGFYEGGAALRWTLTLVHGKEEGDARLKDGSGGSQDEVRYRDGAYEVFDLWSDNSKPVPMEYEAWVREWIGNITVWVDTQKNTLEAAASTKEQIARAGKRSVIKPVK